MSFFCIPSLTLNKGGIKLITYIVRAIHNIHVGIEHYSAYGFNLADKGERWLIGYATISREIEVGLRVALTLVVMTTILDFHMYFLCRAGITAKRNKYTILGYNCFFTEFRCVHQFTPLFSKLPCSKVIIMCSIPGLTALHAAAFSRLLVSGAPVFTRASVRVGNFRGSGVVVRAESLRSLSAGWGWKSRRN